MKVRLAAVSDAPGLRKLKQKLDQETVFRLYEPGESRLTVEEQAEIIRSTEGSHNCAIFVAETESGLIGYLDAWGRAERRVRHSTHISIAVLQASSGQGVGRALLGALLEWAGQKGLHRVELSVMVNNPGAIRLYRQIGFVEEGIKRHSMLIGGQYVDEMYMSLLL